VGPDRPGLVRELAGHIRKLGGNIEDTRMSKLGGEFAVLVLVTGDAAALGELKASAPQLESALGVSCFVRDTSTGARSIGTSLFNFRASGVDHPGIVESITEVLAVRSINVTSFTSWIENAPLTGTPMFVIDVEVELPGKADYQELVSSLGEACARENLEFSSEMTENSTQ
jgi:glycine cleavage system transcriptional repressor